VERGRCAEIIEALEMDRAVRLELVDGLHFARHLVLGWAVKIILRGMSTTGSVWPEALFDLMFIPQMNRRLEDLA
jgi:hypothetical protein